MSLLSFSALIEGLDRGAAIEVTDDWWSQKRNVVAELQQPIA